MTADTRKPESTAGQGRIQTGYRFALRHDVDRFPDFCAKRGMTGTVSRIQDDGLVCARMDQQIDGAQEWDNEVWWQNGIPEFLDDTTPLDR